MAEATPAPEPPTNEEAPVAAERRLSTERKTSTAPAAAPATTETERRPSVERKSLITVTPSEEGQPAASTDNAGTEASDAPAPEHKRGSTSSAPVAAATATTAGADAKSPQGAEEASTTAAGNGTTVTAGATPASGPVSGPTTSPEANQAGSQAANIPASKEMEEEPISLQWDYSIPVPNCYFRPSLVDLCVPVMAKNFAQYPGFGSIPAKERLRVVEEIPLDLSLKLAADMIPEEAYWKRRVQVRWRNCDIVAHGRSWKQCFFERNLQEALERYDATIDKEKEVAEVMQISAPYVHNLDLVQLPSHFDFKLIFSIMQRELIGLRVNYGILETPGARFDWSKWGMKVSDCRALSAALTITATLTKLNLSGNRIDGEKGGLIMLATGGYSLALMIASFRDVFYHRHVLRRKMGILAKGLTVNPTVVDLDLSCNILRDEGVKQVAMVLKDPNSILGLLNLTSNHISPKGCRHLAECEDINRSLVSLNLTSNVFGDLGGKRILDWANNNPTIQRISLECCNVGEDTVQSYARLMHNEHSALNALNLSGNRTIGVKGGETILSGLEAGKQMKELWIANCDCGEEIETKVLSFLVERKFGRTCIHRKWIQEQRPSLLVPAPTPKVDTKPSEEEEKEKVEKERQEKEAEDKRKKEEEDEEDDDERTEEEKKKEEEEEERKKKEEEEAAAAAAKKKEEEDKKKEEEDLIYHVGHGHGEACTLECSRMVGLPSSKPPPEPVVYPETSVAAREAQTAIKKIEDSKPYWGVEALKDMKEKEVNEP